MEKRTDRDIAMRVSNVSIIVNLLLSVFKLMAGIIAHSTAMVTDAVHSASDVFSTFIVMIGFHLSSKDADKEHPYGHERLECVASIVLAVILLITGVEIGRTTINTLFSENREEIVTPGRLALAAAAVSIIAKELMYQYTIRCAKKINSAALKADASSVGALIGIGGARLGFKAAEPLASAVICLFIIKAAVEIFKEAIDKMVDKSCDEETEEQMKKVIIKVSGVKSLVSLHTRMFGSRVYVDTIIGVDGELSLVKAHEIAERVHDDIEDKFPQVKHCMVHVDPA